MRDRVPVTSPPEPRRIRLAWGQWLVTALFAVFLVYLAGHVTTPSALLRHLAQPQWDWAAVALVGQGVSFALYGGLYKYGFRAVGVATGAWRLIGIIFASIFVKTVVPLTGAAAMTVFIDDASTRGQSGARAAAGTIVVTVIDLLIAVPFIGLGMAVLAGRGRLALYDILGTALFVAFIGLLIVGLAVSGLYPSLMETVLHWARRLVNRAGRLVRRPVLLSEGWVRRNAHQFASAAAAIPGHRRDIAIAALFSALLHAVNVVVLYALFLALNRTPGLGVILAGLGAATVFFVIAIVPDGIGAVEGAMALTFVSLGIDPATAILVTLGYRVLTIWAPVVLGFFVARQLRLFGGQGALTGARRDRPAAAS